MGIEIIQHKIPPMIKKQEPSDQVQGVSRKWGDVLHLISQLPE